MASSAAFETVCDRLEQLTSLDRLESRGTVRLLLKSAGLEASSVSGAQMAVAVDRLLGEELETRGVDNVDAVVSELRTSVADLGDDSTADSPDAIFARLGG